MTWPGRWGVRTRIVVAAAGLLAVALVVVTVAGVAVFAAGLQHDLDRQNAAESAVLVDLVRTDRLPAVLPVPTGSTLLAQVLAADGTVLAASPGVSPARALLDPGSRTGSSVVRTTVDTFDAAPLRVLVDRVSTGDGAVTVLVAAPLTDLRRAQQSLRLVLLVVVPLLLAAATAAVWWVTGLALRPVERLRVAAAELADDPMRAASRLPRPPGDDEVSRLATTLDRLLERLRGLVEREQAFVADAAHELRSPVAGLRVQLDVAAAHPSTVDPARLVADLTADVDRLTSLTDGLLALARADAATAVRTPVDLRALAGLDGDAVRVLGDPAALAGVLDNLVVNARRHAAGLVVDVHSDDGWAVLDVDDDGPGIPVADRDRVLGRWVRLDEARMVDAGGAGLGLALVVSTVTAHGGTVAVLDSPLGGARLQVRLPLAPG